MSVEVFLDTNVFVYHLDTSDPRKHRIAEGLVSSALLEGGACISFQVVQECLDTVLRKAEVKLDLPAARLYLDTVLAPLMQSVPGPALYRRALELQSRWGYGFYDSTIVAAALATGCRRLLSEDLQHGQRIETLTIENPFRA